MRPAHPHPARGPGGTTPAKANTEGTRTEPPTTDGHTGPDCYDHCTTAPISPTSPPSLTCRPRPGAIREHVPDGDLREGCPSCYTDGVGGGSAALFGSPHRGIPAQFRPCVGVSPPPLQSPRLHHHRVGTGTYNAHTHNSTDAPAPGNKSRTDAQALVTHTRTLSTRHRVWNVQDEKKTTSAAPSPGAHPGHGAGRWR